MPGVLIVMKIVKSISCRWKKMPNLLTDDRRNYPCIELGIKPVDQSGLDLTQEFSNLFSDFLVLKRMYSLVGKNGIVHINMGQTKSYMFQKSPSIFSLSMLHPVTLMELGWRYYFYEIILRECLNPLLFCLKHFTHNFFPRNNEAGSYNFLLMWQIEEFCRERDVVVEFFIDNVPFRFTASQLDRNCG